MRLATLALVVLVAGCSSESQPRPADADELRARISAALRAEGDRILHLQLLLPSIDGTFEVDREVWVDWSTESVRRAYYGPGSDEAPLTLVVADRQYYPPFTEAHQFDGEIGTLVAEPLEALFLPLLLLRLTDGRATLSEPTVDGDQAWCLEQTGIGFDVGDDDNPCFDVRLDFDVTTYLPRASAAADCGDVILFISRVTAEWLDRDEVPEGFFTPETATSSSGAVDASD